MADKDGTVAGPGNPQPPQAGQTPQAAPGTSGGTEKTYTEAEVQKHLSDVKATAGREKAALQKQYDGIKAQLEAFTKQQEERELDTIRNDPAKLTAYQSRKALEARQQEFAARQADLDAREAALAEREAAIKKASLADAVKRLSATHGIDESKLIDLGIEDVSVLEKVAATISGKSPAPQKQPVTRVDSGKSVGGADLQGMSPQQQIQYGLDQMRRNKGG